MNVGVNKIKTHFAECRKIARHNNPSGLPIINELEDIAIKRAIGKMTPSKARNKIKVCCMKAGVNPIGMDFNPMPQFNFKPKNNNNKPKPLNLKPINILSSNNPRARRRGLFSLPYAPKSSPTPKKQYPSFGLQPIKQTKKKTVFEIKPINFMNQPKRKTSKSNKGFGVKIKPMKWGLK